LRLTAEGQKILARAKVLAAQHEAALKERLGAERHRLLLETLRTVSRLSAKQSFNGHRNTEQAIVLTVTGNQHQASREATVTRDRPRDGAKIKEIHDKRIAQQHRISAREFIRRRDLLYRRRHNRGGRQCQNIN